MNPESYLIINLSFRESILDLSNVLSDSRLLRKK